MTSTTTRPAIALYERQHPAAEELLADRVSPYEWGYEAAAQDWAAGLTPMTADEMESLWHADYTEGYLDFWSVK